MDKDMCAALSSCWYQVINVEHFGRHIWHVFQTATHTHTHLHFYFAFEMAALTIQSFHFYHSYICFWAASHFNDYIIIHMFGMA